MLYWYLITDLGSMAFGRLWLQIGMSGWLTGDYSLRCQPVDYSDRPQVLRVGLRRLPLINTICTLLFVYLFCCRLLLALLKKKDETLKKITCQCTYDVGTHFYEEKMFVFKIFTKFSVIGTNKILWKIDRLYLYRKLVSHKFLLNCYLKLD